MTIKHKCETELVSNKAISESINRSSYHENFNYDGDGWTRWIEINYKVEKCIRCGKPHYLNEKDLH